MFKEWGKKAREVVSGMAMEEFVRVFFPAFVGYVWFIFAAVGTISFLTTEQAKKIIKKVCSNPNTRRWKVHYAVGVLLLYGVAVIYGLVIERMLGVVRKGERADFHFTGSRLFMDGAILKTGLDFVNLGKEPVKPNAMILHAMAIEPRDFNEDELFNPHNLTASATGDAEIMGMQPFHDEVEYRWAILPDKEGSIYNKDLYIYVVTRTYFKDEIGEGNTESCRYWTGIDVYNKHSIDLGREQWCEHHNGPAHYYGAVPWWRWWAKLR